MKKPSKTQLNAINHLSGPAQVVAGPGSGKTFTIIWRIMYLIYYHGISPDNILVITYTKAAAKEMYNRFMKANISENLPSGAFLQSEHIHCGTFHSVCYHILMQSGRLSSRSLLNESEKRHILGIILKNLGMSEKITYDNLSEILNQISRFKNLSPDILQTGKTVLPDFTEEDLNAVIKEYLRFMQEQEKLDFDDILLQCLKLLENEMEICHKYQKQFQFILADEFQDINIPQYKILKILASPEHNLFVVGDDDQAIYGFRGASPGIMQEFLMDFPEAKQILLTENFRSGEKIVHAANQVIIQNTERFSKQFFPVREGGMIQISCFADRKTEEAALCRELQNMTGKMDGKDLYAQTAVILRTNLEAAQYQELLRKQGIPVRTLHLSGTDVFQSFLWEDIRAFLSFVYNGNCRCDFIKFMNKPNHFITRMALPCETISIQHLQKYYAENTDMLITVNKFFRHLKLASVLTPCMAVNLFRKTIGYDLYLLEKATEVQQGELWKRQLDELQYILHECTSFKDIILLENNKKYTKQCNRYEESSGVNVITMHGAKGLEFERVFLPDVNEGIIPGKKCMSKKELEEERRLLYVAITRAKDKLYIYYTNERNRKISRYIENIMIPAQECPPLHIHQILHCQDTRQKHLKQSHTPHHPQ